MYNLCRWYHYGNKKRYHFIDFISKLPLDDLVEYFEQFGTVIKVIIPFDSTKKHHEFKGYAQVTFQKPKDVQYVLGLKKHIILNRKVFFSLLKKQVHCSIALSKKDARQITADRCKKKLFVGGLSQKTSEGNYHFF